MITDVLRVYSAILFAVEVPAILGLARGMPPSTVSPWFDNGRNDSFEMSVVYCSILAFLCVSRAMVVAAPRSKWILLNAALVHAVEIPTFGLLYRRLDHPALGVTVVMAVIIANPFIFLWRCATR
jgi:hypothetical protein